MSVQELEGTSRGLCDRRLRGTITPRQQRSEAADVRSSSRTRRIVIVLDENPETDGEELEEEEEEETADGQSSVTLRSVKGLAGFALIKQQQNAATDLDSRNPNSTLSHLLPTLQPKP